MFAHVITICLATTLHGAPAVVCPTLPLRGRYETIWDCTGTLPAEVVKWWPEAQKLLKLDENDVRGVACARAKDDDDD